MTRRQLAAMALAVVACSHGDEFAAVPVEPSPVRTPAPPRQITFSREGDWAPVWLPDGSAIGYSYHVLERTDRDRCLGFLPPDGGRRVRSICVRGEREYDSLNVVSFHGVSPGGRLAVVVETGDPTLYAPAYRWLYLGPFDGSRPPRRVLAFPYLAPTGHVHYTAMNPTWVDEQTLVYLAGNINYIPGALGIPPDTVHMGVELVRLDLAGDSVAARTVIAGTVGTSSVTLGTQPGTVAFTVGGDAKVYQLDLASGQRTVLYDFGSLGIARDVGIGGGRLTAVVGGRVAYVPFDVIFGIPLQPDSGGPIYAVTLPAGQANVVASSPGVLQYRRPALAPSGRVVVAEAYGFEVKNLGGVLRTVVGKEADLWEFDVP